MTHDLIILAAGLGSRFGGLKQLTPVGPHGEAILDYSIFDAIQAGITRVTLVIRPDMENDLRAIAADRFGSQVEVRSAHQPTPDRRAKPWGTGHALLVGAESLPDPHASYLIINADDHYGPDAFRAAAGALGHTLIAYPLHTTLPVQGTVSRAACSVDGAGNLVGLIEHPSLERYRDGARTPDGAVIPAETSVSMNCWIFQPDFTPILRDAFDRFATDASDTDECMLPNIVADAINADSIRVRVSTEGRDWCGITHPDDLATVRQTIRQRIDEGIYPEHLWN